LHRFSVTATELANPAPTADQHHTDMNHEVHAIDVRGDVPNPSEPEKGPVQVTVPVIAEVAEVTKVEEHVGTLRVSKATHVDEVEIQAPTSRDVVETKRVRFNVPVDKAEAAHYRGDVWVVPVYEERLVKTLFLVEELHLVKRVEQTRHDETVTLRREVLVTERFDVASEKWVVDPS
jgi:stress response protein YsnF